MYRSNGAEDVSIVCMVDDEHEHVHADQDESLQQALGTPPRGFYVAVDADKIRDGDAWSDPVYVDLPGIDQDVSPLHVRSVTL